MLNSAVLIKVWSCSSLAHHYLGKTIPIRRPGKLFKFPL